VCFVWLLSHKWSIAWASQEQYTTCDGQCALKLE